MAKKIKVIKGKGNQKPIKFHQGGLHETTHTPAGQKISQNKLAAAARGDYGKKGEEQVRFMHNVLHK